MSLACVDSSAGILKKLPAVTAYVTETGDPIFSDAPLNMGDTVHEPAGREEHVVRGLASRHQQMIAIGGIIGSGYFVGTGAALATGGPVGLLLGYTIMGAVTYSVAITVGEMAALFPLSGGFVYFATRFVDPALGFALGWDYWYGLAVTIPAEITAGALVISYWEVSTNVAVWITMFLVVIGGANFISVRFYGEVEFWAAIIKVIAVMGCIILGIVIDLGGGPSHDRLGFRYWKDPGPFNQLADIPGTLGRFLSFWSTFVNSAFSYGGVEVIALTAAEASRPEITIPRCIKSVFWRILFFYVGGVFVIGLTVPYTNKLLLDGSGTAVASPFVIAIQTAGIHGLPSVINAVILLSTFSASNSYLFAASRTIYGLACDGQAPKILRRTTKGGLPVVAIFITLVFGLLSFMNLSSSGGTVFQYLYTISAITCVLAWIAILYTYLRFRAGCIYQGIDRSNFPYRAPFQPYMTYFGLVMLTLITLCNGFELFLAANAPFDYSTFFTSYIAIPVFVILYLFWKVAKRTTFVTLAEMDLTGMRSAYKPDDEEAKFADDLEPKRTFKERVLGAVATAWE